MFDIVDKNKWLASLVIAAIIGYLGSLWWRGVLDDVRLANVMGYVWSVGTAISVAGIWHLLLSRWLWRQRWLRKLYYTKCPDLSGRYRATLVPHTFNNTFSEEATIRQTMEDLHYESESKTTGNINKSLSSRVIVDGGRLRCFITYEGTNSKDPNHGMDHQGTIVLTALLDSDGNAPKRIEGYYFTNKPRSKHNLSDRGTYGDITLELLREN